MRRNILVTGGAGYIGSNTVQSLIDSNYNVVIVDNLSTGYTSLIHPNAKFYHIDILNKDAVLNILISEKIDAVIHFAAKIVVPESISNSIDYYTNNTYGLISILQACKMGNVDKIIFSSTAALYGDNSIDLLSEDSPITPTNPYSFSKYFSEQILKDSEKEFGCKHITLRYFNVAGASSNLKFGQITPNATHLIKIASQVATKKKDYMTITGTDYPTKDGTGIRDYIHVSDLADAHKLSLEYLFENNDSNVFNVGYGLGFSVREVISCMKKVSNFNFNVIESSRRPGDVQRLVANSNKIRTTLNWNPRFADLEKICLSAYQFERSLE